MNALPPIATSPMNTPASPVAGAPVRARMPVPVGDSASTPAPLTPTTLPIRPPVAMSDRPQTPNRSAREMPRTPALTWPLPNAVPATPMTSDSPFTPVPVLEFPDTPSAVVDTPITPTRPVPHTPVPLRPSPRTPSDAASPWTPIDPSPLTPSEPVPLTPTRSELPSTPKAAL